MYQRSLLSGIFIVGLLGCGPGRGDLSGTVTFEGKPLRFGTVLVLGGDGIPKSGQIEEGGAYSVKDIQAGPIKVAVTSADPGKSQPAQRVPGTPVPPVDRA